MEDLNGLEVGRNMSHEAYLAHLIGYTDTEILCSINLTPQRIKNARSISVDVDGWVKITYANPYGDGTITEVKYLIGGAEYHIRKVTAWAAVGTLTPAAQVAKSDESLVDGIKLHR